MGTLLAWTGCGKPAAPLTRTISSKGGASDSAPSAKAGAARVTERPARPREELFWGGSGTPGMPDSFGPAGPSPVLLFGSRVAAGEMEFQGDETHGSVIAAQSTDTHLEYERDDDIDARWVELPPPSGDATQVQHFAGMAVWGTVARSAQRTATDEYEAESAIYLTRMPYDQVVAQYTPSDSADPATGLAGKGWTKTDAAPARTADRWVTFIRKGPAETHEVSIAEFASLGLVQVTLARTVKGSAGASASAPMTPPAPGGSAQGKGPGMAMKAGPRGDEPPTPTPKGTGGVRGSAPQPPADGGGGPESPAPAGPNPEQPDTPTL